MPTTASLPPGLFGALVVATVATAPFVTTASASAIIDQSLDQTPMS